MMSDKVKAKYRSSDSRYVVTITWERGLILPPTIEAHVPLHGPVTLYSPGYFPKATP